MDRSRRNLDDLAEGIENRVQQREVEELDSSDSGIPVSRGKRSDSSGDESDSSDSDIPVRLEKRSVLPGDAIPVRGPLGGTRTAR